MTPETLIKCSTKQVEKLTLSLISDIYEGYSTTMNEYPLSRLIFSSDSFDSPAGVNHSVCVNHYNPFTGNFDSISVLFMCDTKEADITNIWQYDHPAHKVTIKVRSALMALGWKVSVRHL